MTLNLGVMDSSLTWGMERTLKKGLVMITNMYKMIPMCLSSYNLFNTYFILSLHMDYLFTITFPHTVYVLSTIICLSLKIRKLKQGDVS